MRTLHENLQRERSVSAIHFAETKEKVLWTTKIKKLCTLKNLKIAILTLTWLATVVIFIVKEEQHLKFYHADVPPKLTKTFKVLGRIEHNRLDLNFKGAFAELSTASTYELMFHAAVGGKKVSRDFTIKLADHTKFEEEDPTPISRILELSEVSEDETSQLNLILSTNCNFTFAMSLAYQYKPFSTQAGIGFGAAVLIGLYILIISEIVDRTFAALIVANLSIAALALFNDRPKLEEIVSWIDVDTLMLLFGMMIMVAITSETGFFDYMAVYVFKVTKGNLWPLICSLSVITMIAALCIDSVSTILLMTPVVIRICEVTNLNPVPVLTIMIVAVNIGSITSPVGNPPNVMIINNSDIAEKGVDFGKFIIHTFPGVVLLIIQSYLQVRYLTFRNVNTLQNDEPLKVANIKHELMMWKTTDRSITAISKFDDISRNVIHSRVALLNEALKRELESDHNIAHKDPGFHFQSKHGATSNIFGSKYKNLSFNVDSSNKHININVEDNKQSKEKVEQIKEMEDMDEDKKTNMDEDKKTNHQELLKHLEEMYPIKNKQLLINCGIAFTFLIVFFCLHSVEPLKNISLGWVSLLGVCLLLIISNNNDFKECLLMVEWSSLLFFAALFVLMESLTKIGLIQFIGDQLSELVKPVEKDYQLLVAVLLVLWVSTIISAFLDNIPLTSMMIKVIITMSAEVTLPIAPLVWALVFGCGIGGNGTLIASSANLVCVGVAEQHGYKFSFMKFFIVGFPIMIVNLILVSIYLCVFHVLIEWH